jgi:hypothetical protein
LPRAQNGETPYIQRQHFGAVIAIHYDGDFVESPEGREGKPVFSSL